MIFADTSFLIALARQSDENHGRADELARNLPDKVATTNQVLSEFVTLTLRKDGSRQAHEAGMKILQSEIVIICTVHEDLPAALELVRKHQKISMCDAISAVVMDKLHMKKVLSFDSDFDTLGFERVC
jgi:predicted nucleic acid-binding protein